MNIEQAKKLAKVAYELNRANKGAWREKMFQHRWRNFFTVWLFIAVCIFFLWIGYTMRESFFLEFYYWFWMVLSSIFLGLGIFTMFSYLWIIVRGRK